MADELVPGAAREILIYQTNDNQTRVQERVGQDTVWLSLNQMAELFQRDKSVISKHIANVFAEGDLAPQGTDAKYATVQQEGFRTAVVAEYATTAADDHVSTTAKRRKPDDRKQSQQYGKDGEPQS